MSNAIPADESGDPTDVFTDDQAVFAYVLSDIKGGEICIVAGTFTEPTGLDCSAEAWGGKNTVVGIGTQFVPLAAPPLKPGTWRLLTTNSEGGDPKLSEPFTVVPCSVGECDYSIAAGILADYKAAAERNLIGAAAVCLTFSAKSIKGLLTKARGRVKGLDATAKDYSTGGGFAALVVGGAGFGLSFVSLPSLSNPGEEKAMEILKNLTCTLTSMYSDIVADPPDPGYRSVATPEYSTIPELPLAAQNAFSRSVDTQRGLGVAALRAFERYQGAVADSVTTYVHAQAAAMDRFTTDQIREIRQTAATARAYADELNSDPDFATPAATAQEREDLIALYERVNTSGFSQAELDQLHTLGYTDAEIDLIRSHFAIDPTLLPADLTVQAVLEGFATTLEGSIPALDALARGASVAAGRTNEPPAPAFSASPVSPSSPLLIRFVDLSTSPDLDAIESISWDFGDGASAEGSPVEHTYAQAGVYDVALRVCDYLVCASLTKKVVAGIENAGPIALDDTLATAQDTTGTVNVLVNDSDPDPGDTLIVTGSTNGTHGNVSCQPAGACTYTPTAGYSGPDSFTYTISDGRGGSATASVSVHVFQPATSIGLVSISTNFNNPIGIDFHQPTNKVAVSVNYPSGLPLNFELIAQDGSHAPFSSIGGFTDEVKIATVRGSSCEGGFQVGELFTGTGVSGVIARIAPDGASVANPWVTLPDELGLMRGSLFQDRFCSFGGDLIAVTTAGGVWRVTSAGAATRIAQIGAHLEGLTTVPNDPARYGPWAGKILAGAEGLARIYAIASDGTVTPYELGIAPEDIDIVPANENFFGVDFSAAEIKGAPASAFADKVGDVVIAQEFPGILWHVRWNAPVQAFEVSEIARVGQWEHVTFARAGITPLPPTNAAPVATDLTAETAQDVPVEITLRATDPDGDSLSFAVVRDPDHGTLGAPSGNTVTYTPNPGYTGPDSFMFKANDGTADSNVATVSIDVFDPCAVPGDPGGVFITGHDADSHAYLGRNNALGAQRLIQRAIAYVTHSKANPQLLLVTGLGDPGTGREHSDPRLGMRASGFTSFDVARAGPAVDGSLDLPTVDLERYDAIIVASDWGGWLTQAEVDRLNGRAGKIIRFINSGGGVVAFAESLVERPFGFLPFVVSRVPFDLFETGIRLTDAGLALGLTEDDVNGNFSHNVFAEASGMDVIDHDAANQILTLAKRGARIGSEGLCNRAPVASDQSVSTDENVPVEITLGASDPEEDPLSFMIVAGPGHGTLGAVSGKKVTYTPHANYTGPDSFTFKASDGSLDSNVAMVSITVAAVKRSTSTTYTGGTSVQYSDPVTLSGTLLDTTVNPHIGIAGRELDFTLGTQSKSAGPTAADGSASTSLGVTQQPGSVTSIETAFGGDASYLASSDSDPFTIAKEDCTLSYSGDVDVAPTAMTALAADLGEPDATRGDRSNKTVVFTVTGVVNATPQVFTATTDTNGHASMLVPLASDVYAVGVSFSGDAFYKSCATTQDAVVTVEAAAAKVTGGGWTSISTGRTNFGFNAIPEAGSLWKGQFQLRSNSNKSKFHARSVATLSGSGNSATWSGTGTWNGLANYAYTISVVDNGSSGSKKGDRISITITSSAGVVVYTTGGFQTLKGGNVTVH